MPNDPQPITTRATLPWRMLICLVLVALFGRAVMPAGYMPDAAAGRDGRLVLTLCAAGSAAGRLALELPAKPGHPPAGDSTLGADCPFGMLAGQAVMPGPLAVADAPAPAPAPAAALPAHRALPPLPAAGPPLGPRAPPRRLA